MENQRIKKVGTRKLENTKTFIEFSQIIDDAYANWEDHNSTKKTKVLTVFDKKTSHIITELFLKGRELNISLVFISQSHFTVPKTIRLQASH